MDQKFIQGLVPDKQPYPLPEFAHGNIVKLKEPLTNKGRLGQWGVIVAHTTRNADGEPMVYLHVYDDEGKLFMNENHIPMYLECYAGEFLIWHLTDAVEDELCVPGGFDLYPDCAACKGSGRATDGKVACPVCRGLGRGQEMQRLPASAIPKPRKPFSC